MKKNFFAFLCFSLAVSVSASEIGDRLRNLLKPSVASELEIQGFAKNTVYREKGTTPVLCPENPIAKESLLFWDGIEAPFYSEALYLYRKPVEFRMKPGKDTQALSIILRSISRLEGLEYYSTSRKKMRTLYEKSYVADIYNPKVRLPDPVEGSADGVTLNALQKDLTFGEYLYNYSYRQNEDTVAFFSRNLNAMHYSFLKVIDPDKLHISLIVHDMGDYLLFYSLTRADFIAIPGIEGKLNASFTSRTEAIYQWFIKEYETK